MFDWLRGRIDAFFTWITSFLTDQFQWLRDVLDSGYKWIVDLVKAIFTSVWDIFVDAVCWLIDKFFDIAKDALDAIDTSTLETFSHLVVLPPEIMNVLSLVGAGTAMAIILAAIAIRMALQLTPFRRMGS